jgi:hypothetical protein
MSSHDRILNDIDERLEALEPPLPAAPRLDLTRLTDAELDTLIQARSMCDEGKLLPRALVRKVERIAATQGFKGIKL